MLAERFILQTDQEGRLTGLPSFTAYESIEVIVLRKESRQPPAPYRLKPASMGQPLAGVNLVKALRLANELEDEALAGKR